LSDKFPDNVITTPISEHSITGLVNGMALGGYRPYLEIMFGDFITLSMDQIINHASKFHHMYNKKVECPVVIRTPMGGGRGYGPTHSQTLDKFLAGIDNVCECVGP
jgi:2-oxoisovalerate dehydrogenase E1 component